MIRKPSLPYLLAALVVLSTLVWLLLIGREPWCKCGTIKLWHGQTMSSESSQHLLNWYSPSHLLHGILFYWVLSPFSRVPVGWRFLVATLVGSLWEVIENSDRIIERYRAVTISLDYFGDSVVNSAVDFMMMVVGFFLARRLPVWASIVIVIGFESRTTWLIRDGLALNVIMLIHPLESIRAWQAAG